MPYFELVDRVWRDEERWHLREPETPEGATPFTWDFTRCAPFESNLPLRARLSRKGTPVDFTLADFDIPILSPRAVAILAPVLTEFCEFLPVAVEGQASGYMVLNVLRAEDCVHEQASQLVVWKRGDGRDDKIGHYRQITQMVLRRGLDLPPIFRLAKFHVRVLVNAQVAAHFGTQGLTGVIPEEIKEEG